VRAWGEIALGVRSHGQAGDRTPTVALNPARDRRWTFTANDEIVALTSAE
jgi:hypothetical protein